jgi:hypothetical protein
MNESLKKWINKWGSHKDLLHLETNVSASLPERKMHTHKEMQNS